MSPEDVIEAYVTDVARRLPGAKRNDVAFELKALLSEDLQNKADEAGRAADEAMALELVRAFGAPDDVADRYRPPGFVIVPPTRSARFAAFALGGVAVQWLVTMPAVLPHLFEPGREFVALGAWWLSAGIGALWWPGFLVTAAIIAGWARHTWPARANAWRPRTEDADLINPTLWVVYAAAAACGVAFLFAAPWLFALLPAQSAAGFAFNASFLPVGGAMATVLWTANAVLFAIVFAEGRWRPFTRHLDLALRAGWVALLAWFVFGPHIFASANSDQVTKGVLAIVLLIVLVDLGVRIYRMARRPQTAAELMATADRNRSLSLLL